MIANAATFGLGRPRKFHSDFGPFSRKPSSLCEPKILASSKRNTRVLRALEVALFSLEVALF